MAEKKATKRKVGRPKKTIDILPENWKEQILSLYDIGGSDVEIKALISKWIGSFSNDLWDRWLVEEPEFSETIKMGKLYCEAWWNSKGREIENRDINSNLFHINMKNRFGWSEKHEIKQETKHEGKIEINYNVPKE